MQITSRVDHFAISAANTLEMTKWYEKVMGLVVHAVGEPKPGQTQKTYLIGPPASGSGLKQGSMIEVMPQNDKPRQERAALDPGLSHAAWYVADFDGALAHLKQCQVKFLSDVIQAVGGGRIISFLDCEGNMMQIVERV